MRSERNGSASASPPPPWPTATPRPWPCPPATSNEFSGGRAILGLGTGDGSTYRLGRKATRLADFAAGLTTIRELLQGRPIEVPRGDEGAGSVTLTSGQLPVPVYVAAEGPRSLRVAGRYADGIMLGTGFDLDVLEWAQAHIAAGARKDGRELSDIDIAMAGMIYVHEDGDLARDRVRARLANRAHHNFRFTYETVPPDELDGVKRFMAGFDISKPLEERADPALITDYLLRRFAIAGTPDECVARIRELAEAGISHVLLTPPTATSTRSWISGDARSSRPAPTPARETLSNGLLRLRNSATLVALRLSYVERSGRTE